jgi:hypothetical protein
VRVVGLVGVDFLNDDVVNFAFNGDAKMFHGVFDRLADAV